MKKIQGVYKIFSNKKITERYCRMQIDAPNIVPKVEPGQFIHVRVTDGLKPFFRRPFSILRAKKYLEIFYEVVGEGTRLLSQKKKGESLDIVGPVGSPFVLPSKNMKQVVMVAGGIGVAPFLALTDRLKGKGFDLTLLYGGRTEEHVFNMKDFANNGCNIEVATDDGSVGVKGRVSELFSLINKCPETTMIYTCGPRPMMKAVQKFAKKNKIKGQASLEEVMACGTGTCLGCATKTINGYKTVCHDGPVFDLNEVVF